MWYICGCWRRNIRSGKMEPVRADNDAPSYTAYSRCVAWWATSDDHEAVVWWGLALMCSWPVERRHWGRTAGAGGRRLGVLWTRHCSNPNDCVQGLCEGVESVQWQRSLDDSYLPGWSVARRQDVVDVSSHRHEHAEISRWLNWCCTRSGPRVEHLRLERDGVDVEERIRWTLSWRYSVAQNVKSYQLEPKGFQVKSYLHVWQVLVYQVVQVFEQKYYWCTLFGSS